MIDSILQSLSISKCSHILKIKRLLNVTIIDDTSANRAICRLLGSNASTNSIGRFIITNIGCRKFHDIILLSISFG